MSVEEQIILNCMRYNLDPRQFNEPDLPTDIDWDRLFRASQDHRALGSLLYIEKSIPGFWPELFSKKITSYRYLLLLNSTDAVHRIHAILAGLADAQIPAVVMKGWEYIQTVYSGQYSLRPCGDIDILIQPKYLKSAEKVLAKSGYLPTIELWPGFRYRYHNVAHHFELEQGIDRGFEFGVDLHWGLFNRPYQDQLIQIDEIFDRALPLQIGDTSVLRLCTEDHILHACGHLNLHHGGSPELFRFYELAWVIRHAEPAVNWQVVFERAAQWKLQIPLQSTLIELERIFPGALPEPVVDKLSHLQVDRRESDAYHLMMKYRDTPFVHVLPFRWSPAAIWESLCYLFEAFVPGPQFLQHRYGKIRFWPLHYLRRAVNSIKQLITFSQNGK